MRYLETASITIASNRQRRQFDEQALSDLADSIRKNGLLHPIVVRTDGNGSSPVLVAGERRLRAVQLLEIQGYRFGYSDVEVPFGMIPANDLGDLSEEEAWEAELEENVQRVDLSWQERTDAIASLHRLQELRAGRKLPPSETAPAIMGTDGNPAAAGQAVRRALVLQQQIAADPEVAKARTERDAWKIVQRKEQARVHEALAAEVGTRSASELHTVIQSDCREWLAAAPHQQFDVILIDPPYGMDAHDFGDAAGKLVGIEHGYTDDRDYALGLMRTIAANLWLVAKEQAHLYVWCDIDQFGDLKQIFAETGWWVHRTPLINIKREGGRVPWPEHGPRRCYELVLYANKGKRPVTAIYRDIFESTLEGDTGGHGAAKPVEAYVDLLRRSCRPGDSVLDCFAGTGTILEAAHRVRVRATAVEVNPAYYGMCLKRLEALK